MAETNSWRTIDSHVFLEQLKEPECLAALMQLCGLRSTELLRIKTIERRPLLNPPAGIVGLCPMLQHLSGLRSNELLHTKLSDFVVA